MLGRCFLWVFMFRFLFGFLTVYLVLHRIMVVLVWVCWRVRLIGFY